MSLNEVLHWRYAPKRMTGGQVPENDIASILKAAQYAPTSMGLQPFSIFLVESPGLRESIRPIAFNQPQIGESSHLLIYAAYNTLTEQHIDHYLQNIVQTRLVSMESLVPFRNAMMNFTRTHTPEQIRSWANNQVYLSLGFCLAEAALIGVDATPMEGFDADALDQLLGLPALDLHSTTMVALGYRDTEKDFLANQKKVRRSLDHLVTRL